MIFGNISWRTKQSGNPMQKLAWWLREQADKLDGYQSYAIKVNADLSRDEIRSAFRAAVKHMGEELSTLATLNYLDDMVE